MNTAPTTTAPDVERGPLEVIYDEQIAPLVEQIRDICKRYDMPFVVGVGLDTGRLSENALWHKGHLSQIRAAIIALQANSKPDSEQVEESAK